MTRRLLSSLNRRVRSLLPGTASPDAVAAPELDLLRQPLVADYAPDAGGTRFGAMFQAAAHRSALAPDRLDAEIRTRARAIMGTQPDYQPVYGFTAEFPARRTKHLERNVHIVCDALKDVDRPQQPRILDVGCNMGYVALRIAETHPNVVGLEISRPHLDLCRLMAARAGSPARFFGDDMLAMLARGDDDDLEQVDVLLLYNVVHQFIFHQGVPATKALLARLAARVDTLIVELALQSDYVRHGKDQLLPVDPAEVLSDCTDVKIDKLYDTPRPVYRLRRRTVRLGTVSIPATRIGYSLHRDPMVSRKFVIGGNRFLKLFRFTRPGDRTAYEREVAALQSLQGSGAAPRLFDACATAHAGAVLMEFVSGHRVSTQLFRADPPLRPAQRMLLTCEYLRIAKAVHDAVGYQNDLQAHNLMWQHPNRLLLVDYEQAEARPTNDPFGLFLWSMFDFWGGRSKDRAAAIVSLRLPAETPPIYPRFDSVKLPPVVAEVVRTAEKGGDWGAFLTLACRRLGVGTPQ